jgi:multidrug efflux pump subunit AcrA (membrane-fusion protein)
MIRALLLGVVAALAAAIAVPATAHEGHDDAPETSSAGVGVNPIVRVSPEARANLGLELVEAGIRPMESTLAVIGEIAPLPDRAGAVTSRIAGRVTWIGVAEGDRVRKGDPLVEVESLQLGDPPPRTRYSAPLSGRIVDRHVGPGDSVEPNAHLLEVADLGEVLAVGHLFEGQIGRVKVGQKARVRVPSYPDVVFEGVVERIGSALDLTTRSLPVYVRVPNSEGQLRPRMPAELAVVVASTDAALSIPRSALLGDFGNEFVFVEQDPEQGLFKRVPVVRGLDDDQFVEIVEGLLPGDRVVTVGNYSLQFLPAHEEPAPGDPSASHHEGESLAHEHSGVSWRNALIGGAGLIAIGVAAVAIVRRRALRGRV